MPSIRLVCREVAPFNDFSAKWLVVLWAERGPYEGSFRIEVADRDAASVFKVGQVYELPLMGLPGA